MSKKIFFFYLLFFCNFSLFAQEYAEIQHTNDSDGLANERFANCMTSSGTIVAVGSPQKQVLINNSQGYVHIYEKSASGIDFIKKITASDGEASDLFGISVALSGDILVVGSQNKTVGSNFFQGAAYVFSRNQGGTNNWGLVKKVVASDGAANDFFGHSVAINGNNIAVGAYQRNGKIGAVYLYSKTQGGANNWGETQILTPSDGAANDYFGHSLALNSTTIAVGANGAQANKGAVYLYNISNGSETKKLVAADGASSDEFGYSLALNENFLLVGARNNTAYQGAAYLFEKSSNWAQKKKLVAADAVGGDAFGYSVALTTDAALVGARVKKVGNNVAQGAAYIFEINQGGAGNWGQSSKISSSDGGFAENFGEAVTFLAEDALVSSPSHKITGKATLGQIYFYKRIGGKVPNISGTYYANQFVTDKSGWTHFWNDGNDYLILSIKLTNLTLGTKLTPTPSASGDYSVAVNITSPRKPQNITAPYVTNPNGWWASASTWQVKSDKVPFSKAVSVRTYYNNEDIDALIDTVNANLGAINSINDLKYFLLAKDFSAFNNTHSGADSIFYVSYGSKSTDSTWTSSNWNGKNYAEYLTKSVTSGGLAAAGGAGEPFISAIKYLFGVNQLAVNEINWAIDKNAPNKTFSVQHSRDGSSFYTMGTTSQSTTDANDPTAISYTYKDTQPFGKTFYRLMQTDANGLITYSYQTMVKIQDTIMIYPNPTENQLNILYSYRLFKSPYNVKITNMQGQVIYDENIVSEDAAGIIRLSLLDLPSGVYIINAMDAEKQRLGQARFIKQ